MTPSVDVRRAGDRFVTRTDWLESWHSFSYGRHYDPANTSFGSLHAHNDDVLAPGGGFAMHRHRDVEIVTWVLEGVLRHEDSMGHRETLRPGMVQVLTAGSGVEHSERNASTDDPVRCLQMWLSPVEPGSPPCYERRDLSSALARDGLVEVAHVNRGSDTLYAARLSDGERLPMAAAPYLHLFVARGSVRLDGAGGLVAGDAVRMTDQEEARLMATDGCEVLVWAMSRDPA